MFFFKRSLTAVSYCAGMTNTFGIMLQCARIYHASAVCLDGSFLFSCRVYHVVTQRLIPCCYTTLLSTTMWTNGHPVLILAYSFKPLGHIHLKNNNSLHYHYNNISLKCSPRNSLQDPSFPVNDSSANKVNIIFTEDCWSSVKLKNTHSKFNTTA